MELPDQFRGTEIEDLTVTLRKRVLWHQAGVMDREDASEVIRVMQKLATEIDKTLGIEDPQIGKYD